MTRQVISTAALLALGALAVGLGGCDSGSCERSGLGCPATEPGDGPVVAGVDLGALFAAPRGEEIEAVLAGWQSAPDSAAQLREVAVVELGGRETVRVVEGLRPGLGVAFVGAVRQPPREPGDARQRPLLLVLGDGPDADVDELIRDLAVREDLQDDVVMVFLAYRGGALRVGGRSFASAAPPDPYAADGEDAWAFVTGLGGIVDDPTIDFDRLAIVGHGRGGNVALLEAARARERGRGVPSYVLVLSAPSSFFTPTAQFSARQALEGRPVGSLPAVGGVLEATALAVRDGERSVAEARLGLLRRSGAFFFAPPRLRAPPFLFAAVPGSNVVVPQEDARVLDFLSGAPDRGLYLELEGGTHASVQSNGQVLSTGAAYLCDLLLDGAPAEC